MPAECSAEVKVKDCVLSCSLLITAESSGIGEVIDCKQSCKLQKLRATVYVQKFVQYFKSIIGENKRVIDWTVTAVGIEQIELE